MRRLLFVVLLIVGATFVPTAGVRGADKITFTVGQLQNVDSLNVTVGCTGHRLRDLEPDLAVAHQHGGQGLLC